MGYLVTPGAAGTWALAEVAGLALKNGDPSFNPHTRDTSSVPDDACVAHLYSNAFDTLVSFERRGFTADPAHCRHLGGDMDMFHREPHRAFDLEGHFDAWMSRPHTAFVKYESLPWNADRLGNWIGADLSRFEFKTRAASSMPVNFMVAYHASDLIRRQYAMPDWFVTE